MESGGKEVGLPTDMLDSYMVIKKDGSFDEIDNGKISSGKWQLNNLKKILAIKDKDGKENWSILKLTETDLHLSSKFQGMKMTMIMKKVE